MCAGTTPREQRRFVVAEAFVARTPVGLGGFVHGCPSYQATPRTISFCDPQTPCISTGSPPRSLARSLARSRPCASRSRSPRVPATPARRALDDAPGHADLADRSDRVADPARAPAEPPATRGPVAADCVNGWVTPPRDSARYAEPLRVIRRMSGVQGPLEVVDLRLRGTRVAALGQGVPAGRPPLVRQGVREARPLVPGTVPRGVPGVRDRSGRGRSLRHGRLPVAGLGRVPVRQRRPRGAYPGLPGSGRACPTTS